MSVHIIDFGSQYTQLIARRVRELNIYCEIHPCTHLPKIDTSTQAVILSGSPYSVNDSKALEVDLDEYINKFPILGVCYGAQYIAARLGGSVHSSNKREYGKAHLEFSKDHDTFLGGIKKQSQIWMSHADSINSIPEGFEIIANTASIPVAAFKSNSPKYTKPIYCIQFHPEVSHSLQGSQFLKNFLVDIAGCKQDWTPKAFVRDTVSELQSKLGTDKVLLGLSGGVDSTVAAVLLDKAIAKNLYCFFIDNGLLRKNEFESVLKSYHGMGLNVQGIRASKKFLAALKGVSDPELKRKAIGKVFIEVFQEEALKIKGIKWLGQGTIYPDVIESVSVHGPSATIKSHHNVGGLPDSLDLELVEPLRSLFKDEVRRVGHELDIPDEILSRHPFPGPGLGIRILGDITEAKIKLCQEADAIFINLLHEYGYYKKVWQAGAILLPVKSVGVMGDERTYEYTIALRSVDSVDGMTAEWSDLPRELLAKISSDIINNVKGINRVVYDISTKPPATIEWE